MLECSLKMRKECKLWKHCCECYDSGKLPPCAAESAEKSDNTSSPKFSYDELVSKLENKHGARKWVVEKWYVVRKVYDIMVENFGR